MQRYFGWELLTKRTKSSPKLQQNWVRAIHSSCAALIQVNNYTDLPPLSAEFAMMLYSSWKRLTQASTEATVGLYTAASCLQCQQTVDSNNYQNNDTKSTVGSDIARRLCATTSTTWQAHRFLSESQTSGSRGNLRLSHFVWNCFDALHTNWTLSPSRIYYALLFSAYGNLHALCLQRCYLLSGDILPIFSPRVTHHTPICRLKMAGVANFFFPSSFSLVSILVCLT